MWNPSSGLGVKYLFQYQFKVTNKNLSLGSSLSLNKSTNSFSVMYLLKKRNESRSVTIISAFTQLGKQITTQKQQHNRKIKCVGAWKWNRDSELRVGWNKMYHVEVCRMDPAPSNYQVLGLLQLTLLPGKSVLFPFFTQAVNIANELLFQVIMKPNLYPPWHRTRDFMLFLSAEPD